MNGWIISLLYVGSFDVKYNSNALSPLYLNKPSPRHQEISTWGGGVGVLKGTSS